MKNIQGNKYRMKRIAKAYASQGYKTYAQMTVIGERAIVHLIHVYRYGDKGTSFESSIVYFGKASTAIKAISEAIEACPKTFSVWYTITDFSDHTQEKAPETA